MSSTNNHLAYSDDEAEEEYHTVMNEEHPEEEPVTIRVIAPATLGEGYTFDVMVDDAPYTVEVPRGGVKEGEEFDVLYEPELQQQQEEEEDKRRDSRERPPPPRRERPEDESTAYNPYATLEQSVVYRNFTMPVMSEESDSKTRGSKEELTVYDPSTGAPIGRWRNPLCACCDVLTQSTFWMGVCCTPVLVAQLVTRLGLTWNGKKGSREEAALSFNRIVLGMMITLAIWKIPLFGDACLLAFYFLIVVYAGARVRRHFRDRYKIPASLSSRPCADRIDDGCCMLFCGCCSAIQMARHTHDDKEYPGFGCTTTGLSPDAPEIV